MMSVRSNKTTTAHITTTIVIEALPLLLLAVPWSMAPPAFTVGVVAMPVVASVETVVVAAEMSSDANGHMLQVRVLEDTQSVPLAVTVITLPSGSTNPLYAAGVSTTDTEMPSVSALRRRAPSSEEAGSRTMRTWRTPPGSQPGNVSLADCNHATTNSRT